MRTQSMKTVKMGAALGARSGPARSGGADVRVEHSLARRVLDVLSPRLLFVCLVILLLAASAAVGWSQTGGTYDLTWSSVDGGGATSTGGAFEVLGVIGQPDAALLSGGTFELTSGFLNYDTAQVPVELSGFVLE